VTVYIANAFSLSMITPPSTLSVIEAGEDNVKRIVASGFTSVIGHEATAKIVSSRLGISVQVNRVSIQLRPGDLLVVFQLLKRLEEGKVLTEDEMKQVQAKWYVLSVLTQGGE